MKEENHIGEDVVAKSQLRKRAEYSGSSGAEKYHKTKNFS